MSGTIELERRREAYRAAFRRWMLGAELQCKADGVEGAEPPEAVEARRAYRDSRDRLAEYLLRGKRKREVKPASQATHC